MDKHSKRRLYTVLVCLNLVLIWGNSLMTGDDSGSLSGGIVAWLGQFLPFFTTELGHTILRKAAHFSEFCLLGLLTSLRQKSGDKPLYISLTGFGLAAACIDETIQIYVPGRGSSLIDVWIDASGFATGLALVALGYTLIKRKKQGD